MGKRSCWSLAPPVKDFEMQGVEGYPASTSIAEPAATGEERCEFEDFGLLFRRERLMAIPACRARILPAASFSYHLAVGILAVRLTDTPARCPEKTCTSTRERPCQTHKRKARAEALAFYITQKPYDYLLLNFFLPKPAKPIRPVPKRNKVVGSGAVWTVTLTTIS